MVQMNDEPLDVYVKFPCIPTNRSLPAASRVDPHHRCDQGNIEADFVSLHPDVLPFHASSPILCFQ